MSYPARVAALCLAAMHVCGGARPAHSEDLAHPAHGELQPRFEVRAARLDAEAAHNSVDGRFRLQSRLQATPAGTQYGIQLELRAKVELAGGALCATGNDALFSDGFESP